MELYANTTEYNFDDPCYENGDTLKQTQKLRFVDYHENDTKTAPVSKRYKFVGNLYDTEENLKAERATRSVRTFSCCCCFLGFTLGCVFATGVCVLVYYFVLPYLVPSPKGMLHGYYFSYLLFFTFRTFRTVQFLIHQMDILINTALV